MVMLVSKEGTILIFKKGHDFEQNDLAQSQLIQDSLKIHTYDWYYIQRTAYICNGKDDNGNFQYAKTFGEVLTFPCQKPSSWVEERDSERGFDSSSHILRYTYPVQSTARNCRHDYQLPPRI